MCLMILLHAIWGVSDIDSSILSHFLQYTHTHTNSASSRGGLHPNELLSLSRACSQCLPCSHKHTSRCAALCADALCVVMLSLLLFALGSRGAHGVLKAENDPEAAGWLLTKRCTCSIGLLRFRRVTTSSIAWNWGGMTHAGLPPPPLTFELKNSPKSSL